MMILFLFLSYEHSYLLTYLGMMPLKVIARAGAHPFLWYSFQE